MTAAELKAFAEFLGLAGMWHASQGSQYGKVFDGAVAATQILTFLKENEKELERLREYEWMYKDLSDDAHAEEYQGSRE